MHHITALHRTKKIIFFCDCVCVCVIESVCVCVIEI